MSDTAPAVEHDPSHASDHAYRLIRAQILSGERAGGDWLREGDLAESIGVSRTPVREALRRLTAEGLVSHERNRGVQVAAWTAEDLDEIFSLRSVLEPWACRLAAMSASVDLDELDGSRTRWTRPREVPSRTSIGSRSSTTASTG